MLPLAICIAIMFALVYNLYMTRLLNAEEVLDLMLNHISLSRYDQKFFYNLQITNVLSRKPITTNQLTLFKKVVKKYRTQLGKKNYDANELSELPWTLKIVQSSPEYTQAHISIEDDELILRCPYKQSFVQEFRDRSLMTWNRERKLYNSEFGLYKLKLVIGNVMKHYDQISFCDTIKDIINEVGIYDNDLFWNPTLVKRCGRLYIANLNESLKKEIDNITLDTSLSTISKLVGLGITIDIDLKEELSKIYDKKDLIFSANRDITYEVYDVEGLADKLKKINCDYVMFLTSPFSAKDTYNFGKELQTYLDIPVYTNDTNKFTTEPYNDYKMPVLIRSMTAYTVNFSGKYHAAKVIHLVNSNQIELK